MPQATVTVRELKNKDTGLDLSVPTHKVIPGLIRSTVEYHVVVVSELHFFKSPKHRETDVVQYMIPKLFKDFEEMYEKLDQCFSGTALPPLPGKKVLMNDSAITERRVKLDGLLKFLAQTPKLCTSPILLEFLGVNSIKAGKYRKGEMKGGGEEGKQEAEEEEDTAVNEDSESQKQGLFGEEDEEDEEDELFGNQPGRKNTDSDLFSDTAADTEESNKLFEDPDLGGGIIEGEADDLFLVAGAEVKVTPQQTIVEDNSDLLNIEDDLDQLMKVSSKKPKPKPKPDIATKPALTTKPAIATKPAVATKPAIASKPSVAKNTKPILPAKPGGDSKPQLSASKEEDLFSAPDVSSDMGTDDIMKYIESQTSQSEADLDLFS